MERQTTDSYIFHSAQDRVTLGGATTPEGSAVSTDLLSPFNKYKNRQKDGKRTHRMYKSINIYILNIQKFKQI